MLKTNFDSSSSGLNITVDVGYDNDLSRIYFEDNFSTITEGHNEFLVYNEGQFSEFKKEYSFTKAELLAAWSSIESKVEFLNNFRSRMGFGYSKATKQDLIDYCETETGGGSDWLEFQDNAGFKANFDIVVSRGYSQGDYKEVIVPHKFWDIAGIPKPLDVQSNLGTYIDNLLWDCPVCARFSVNDVDFDMCESMYNMYNWDKAEALEIAAKLIKDSFTSEEQTTIMDFLASSLKTDLDYQ